MDTVKQLQVAELARLVDRFLELKPEYSGAFWDSMQFAEFVMGKFQEIEIQEFERQHEMALEEASRSKS